MAGLVPAHSLIGLVILEVDAATSAMTRKKTRPALRPGEVLWRCV
jgi:hypothetical protein